MVLKMFKRKTKKCPKCGKEVKDSWKFCPNCGEELISDKSITKGVGTKSGRVKSGQRSTLFPSPFKIFLGGPFKSIFDDVEKEFERIDKAFAFDSFDNLEIDKRDLRKRPRMKGGGISITIRSGTGMRPVVEVRTSGDYKRIEPEIKRKLGVRPAIEEVEDTDKVVGVKKKVRRKPPKVTEEPEAKIKTIGNKKIVSIKLPDVKSEDDINVRRLEQSVEIKAFAGDKVYFKLIPISKHAYVSKKFKDGILKIEIEK